MSSPNSEDSNFSALHTDIHESNNESDDGSVDKEKVFTKLRVLHLTAAIFMGIQTIAYGVVGADVQINPTVGMPKTCEGPICEPNMKILVERNPIWIITLFVALACFDHLVTTLVSYFFPATVKYWLFEVKSNPLR